MYVKNCDLGLDNAALGLRLRAAFSRPRSQFFTVLTCQAADMIYLLFRIYSVLMLMIPVKKLRKNAGNILIFSQHFMAFDNNSTLLILSFFQHLSYQSLGMDQFRYNQENMVTHCQQFTFNLYFKTQRRRWSIL